MFLPASSMIVLKWQRLFELREEQMEKSGLKYEKFSSGKFFRKEFLEIINDALEITLFTYLHISSVVKLIQT